MTVAEWADDLQFTTDHAYRLLAAGEVRGAERIGRRSWRINRAAWEATPSTEQSEPPAAATAEGSERSTS